MRQYFIRTKEDQAIPYDTLEACVNASRKYGNPVYATWLEDEVKELPWNEQVRTTQRLCEEQLATSEIIFSHGQFLGSTDGD